MVQLWAAVMPAGLLSKTTHWLGGRPSLMEADRNLWLMVSIPSSAVTKAWKKWLSCSRSRTRLIVTLHATSRSEPMLTMASHIQGIVAHAAIAVTIVGELCKSLIGTK